MKKQPTAPKSHEVAIEPLPPQLMEVAPDAYLRVLAEVVEAVIRRQGPQDPQLPVIA